MVIAGLQKNSLIDYPGKVSAVAFVSGCNFSCPYCHNPELARGCYPQRICVDEFLDFLSRRKILLDAVVITGGEPTLWRHLPELCRGIKSLNLAVKLDTNGSRPEILKSVIDDELVDYIAMDIKSSIENYGPPLCNRGVGPKVKQSIGIIMAAAVDYEFRTTCVPPFVDEAILVRIAREIQNARRYILQPFRPDRVLNTEFFDDNRGAISPDRMKRFKSAVIPWVPTCRIR
ncbi:MAG: anaerobic ribonucleoside-triphosphate reductase activating protein [Desulfobacteraceae bacterium]|jgi:pyruvate formate lyase activating enzyme